VSSPVVACQRLPKPDVPLPLDSRIVPLPQLPTYNSSSSQGLNCSSPLTNSPTNLLYSPDSQAGCHFTPTFYSSHSRLKSQDSDLMTAGPRYIASVRTAQRTPLPADLLFRAVLLWPLPTTGRYLQSHYLATAIV
jgi:hypothetical protein